MTIPVRPDATATNSLHSWLAKHINTIGPATPQPHNLGERLLQQVESTGASLGHDLLIAPGEHLDNAIQAVRGGNSPSVAANEALLALGTAAANVGAPEREPERIAAAAIRTGDGQVLSGLSHAAILLDHPAAADEAARDGFLTTRGRFVNREEAFALGQAAKQVRGDGLYESATPVLHAGDVKRYADSVATAMPKLARRFAVLTAENPGGVGASEGDNLVASLKLQDELRALGHNPVPVNGRYTDEQNGNLLTEHSFYVPGMTRAQAIALGKKYGQNSVVTQEGLHDLNAGITYPTQGIVAGTPDLHTEFPDGTSFKHVIDWGVTRPTGALPPQTDVRRWIAPKIPQSRIDDVQQEALNTFLGPDFEQMTHDGNFPDWYWQRSNPQRAVDALGDVEGPQAFQRLMEMMGATTARSAPPNNLRRASYYRGLEQAGLLDPEALRAKAYKDVPQGMGHLANNTHHSALANLLEEGEINSELNPKPAGFVENLTGNFRPYTNDTRMATGTAMVNPKLLDLGAIVKSIGAKGEVTYSPRDWAYAPMERAAQEAAHHYASRGLLDVPSGADPTAFWQAKVWDALSSRLPGASPSQGTMDDILNDALTRNAHQWGVSPTVANSLFWRGHPLDLPLKTDVVPKGLLNLFLP